MNNTTFFNSVELPTTQSFPTITFPRINAPGLTSVPSSIINGPFNVAVFAIVTSLAIHISSCGWSNLSFGKVLPNSIIKSPILANTSHGYSTPSNNLAAIVSFKSYKSFILYILAPLFVNYFSFTI